MKVFLESNLFQVKEGKISGKALVPTFSLNNNGYVPEVAEMNDGICVPIDWNHDHREGAGDVCFTYDRESRTLNYEGLVRDKFILSEIKKHKEEGKQMHVSIEADVTQAQEVCSNKKCYNIALEMKITRLAITPTPGITSTTLTLAESTKLEDDNINQNNTITWSSGITTFPYYTTTTNTLTESDELEVIDKKLDKIIDNQKKKCPDCGEDME